MRLTAESIKGLIREGKPPLVESPGGFVDERLNFIEGSCFDLILEEVRAFSADNIIPLLGRDERVIPATAPAPCWRRINPSNPQETEIDTWSLWPGTVYLFQSVETINLPPYLWGEVESRTSNFRAGLIMACSSIKPGYRGKITTGVSVTGGPVHVQRGYRFCSVKFGTFITSEHFDMYPALRSRDLANEVDLYGGVWGDATDNRTTTDGESIRSF